MLINLLRSRTIERHIFGLDGFICEGVVDVSFLLDVFTDFRDKTKEDAIVSSLYPIQNDGFFHFYYLHQKREY